MELPIVKVLAWVGHIIRWLGQVAFPVLTLMLELDVEDNVPVKTLIEAVKAGNTPKSEQPK